MCVSFKLCCEIVRVFSRNVKCNVADDETSDIAVFFDT